jgi:Ricin-type beta-trefoil lectin domain
MNTQIAQTEEALRRQVLLTMPLFQMRSMIDTLFLYAHGGDDLTEAAERIALAVKPNLCLDVQWGNPTSQTPVWLWNCYGGDAQRWTYYRQSGLIRNPVYGKCLEVQWGNPAPGTPVWTSDCTGNDAQRWTYDPEEGVLQNALGTVLQVKVPIREVCRAHLGGLCIPRQDFSDYDAIKAGTSVWTGMRGKAQSQEWLTSSNRRALKRVE